MELLRPLVLVGMMGAGKSTVGIRLARALKVTFTDMDHAIEEATGFSISDIFASYGEPTFRELELKTAQYLLSKPPHIIASGGGAFAQPAIRELMNREAITLWLAAPIEVLLERVSRRDTRPLLQTGDKGEILESLMRAREPFYREAQLAIDSDTGPHEMVVQRILHTLKNLEPPVISGNIDALIASLEAKHGHE